MIAVDTNILVYALRADSPQHSRAHQALSTLADSRSPWGLPATCLHEFVAVATHPRIYVPPTPRSIALDFVQALLDSGAMLLFETDGYWPIFRKLVDRAKVDGPRIHDARIAAICLHHGIETLWTADRDFGRFAELRTINPLA